MSNAKMHLQIDEKQISAYRTIVNYISSDTTNLHLYGQKSLTLLSEF